MKFRPDRMGKDKFCKTAFSETMRRDSSGNSFKCFMAGLASAKSALKLNMAIV